MKSKRRVNRRKGGSNGLLKPIQRLFTRKNASIQEQEQQDHPQPHDHHPTPPSLHTYKVLVIGGGGDAMAWYRDGFYTIGDHEGTNFGHNKDWKDISFWHELYETLEQIKFKAIIFDYYSEVWLSKEVPVLEYMKEVIYNVLEDDGIIMFPPRSNSIMPLFKRCLQTTKHKFYHNATLVYGASPMETYEIVSKMADITNTNLKAYDKKHGVIPPDELDRMMTKNPAYVVPSDNRDVQYLYNHHEYGVMRFQPPRADVGFCLRMYIGPYTGC